MKRPVLLQKRAMTVISKSCYGAHTDPIFKNLLYILPLNDMYLAEIGKIMFQCNTGSLSFKCMRFISFFICTLSLRIIVSQPVYRSVKLPLRLS